MKQTPVDTQAACATPILPARRVAKQMTAAGHDKTGARTEAPRLASGAPGCRRRGVGCEQCSILRRITPDAAPAIGLAPAPRPVGVGRARLVHAVQPNRDTLCAAAQRQVTAGPQDKPASARSTTPDAKTAYRRTASVPVPMSVPVPVPVPMAVEIMRDGVAANLTHAPKATASADRKSVTALAARPWHRVTRALAAAARTTIAHMSDPQSLRRCLDIAVAGSVLLLLWPVLALTALAIKLDSRGAVLFKQIRVGRDGTPFLMYKFRSMTVDAEARRADVLATSDREGVCFKSRTDPRVTAVGRFIRRFSIDEVPQIINVLRGEMSIVGPRPALASEVAAYPPRALGRLAVKPGITGVWQVSGRADIDFDHMIEMDLAYASSRTIKGDIIVILKTFRAVLSARGAY